MQSLFARRPAGSCYTIIFTALRCTATTASAPRAGPPTTIKTFADLSSWLKRFLIRVHPDVVQSHGKEVVELNQASLQECLRFFDGIKAQCSEKSPAVGPAPALRSRYELSFYVFKSGSAKRAGGSVDENSLQRGALARITAVLPVPRLFSDRAARLIQQGRENEARAHWLELGRVTLQVRRRGGLSRDLL